MLKILLEILREACERLPGKGSGGLEYGKI
jgi:hypothetical protein